MTGTGRTLPSLSARAKSDVQVHASAVVEPGAVLGAGVVVEAFAFVGAGVVLGAGSRLWPHSAVFGPSHFGKNNQFHPQCCIGSPPQDRSFRDEETWLEVGDDNVFREHTTVHRGTEKGGSVTRIGSRNLLMVGAHVAHDDEIGSDVTLTNRVSLGGHVQIADGAVLGGHVAIAPFVHVGRLAFIAGGAMVERDVPPFLIAAGDRAKIRGVNRVGMKRATLGDDSIHAVERAYRHVWGGDEPLHTRLGSLPQDIAEHPLVAELVRFLHQTRLEDRRYLVSISRSKAASTSSSS
jgi:UDP-N-acetylglucosamine acyltransferase